MTNHVAANSDITLGAGELFMQAFAGSIPADAALEVAANNVGHTQGGAVVTYKPDVYDVENSYGQIVKSVITKEEVTLKSGILTWNLDRINSLSTGTVATEGNKKTLTIGGHSALPKMVIRFVHTLDDGRKIRTTLVGVSTNGFELTFQGDKETVIDAEFKAFMAVDGMLLKIEEELEVPTDD